MRIILETKKTQSHFHAIAIFFSNCSPTKVLVGSVQLRQLYLNGLKKSLFKEDFLTSYSQTEFLFLCCLQQMALLGFIDLSPYAAARFELASV